jgi:hypothetical protein
MFARTVTALALSLTFAAAHAGDNVDRRDAAKDAKALVTEQMKEIKEQLKDAKAAKSADKAEAALHKAEGKLEALKAKLAAVK